MSAALGLSHRRRLLDAELADHARRFAGFVLEIGALRTRRGGFRQPDIGVSWLRLDIAQTEQPDVVADVQYLPVRDDSIDWVDIAPGLTSQQRAALREAYDTSFYS